LKVSFAEVLMAAELAVDTLSRNALLEPPRVTELDGLRGLAVLLVMSLHFELLKCGWIGVQLFFVLSGYLISGILLRTRGSGLKSYLLRFYRNRTLRILPAYVGYVAFVALFFALFKVPRAFGQYWPNIVTFTFNFCRWHHPWANHPLITPLWSLAVEEQFYLFWPFLVFALGRNRLATTAWFLIVIGPAIRYLTGVALEAGGRTEVDVAEGVYWSTFSHVDAFAAGALVASQSIVALDRAPRWLGAAVVSIAALAGLSNLLCVCRDLGPAWLDGISTLGYPLGSIARLQHVWSYSLLNLVAAFAIVRVRTGRSQGVFAKALRARWLTSVGRVSYGMYLIHWPVQAIWAHFFGLMSSLRLIAFVPYVVTVYALAWLSFNFVERRFLALRSHSTV
jgi:peptidoglycan/LPS O-acetylase OafA/YrhL